MSEKPTNVKQFLNDFDIIDYKRPIGRGNDWRTSTYRAHIYLNDANMQNNLRVKLKPSKEYANDYKLEQSRISDYKDNYLWPPHETGTLTNPKMMFKHQFIKPFEERKLKFLKRTMRPATSSTHQDYQWHPDPPEVPPPPLQLPAAVATTNIQINRNQPGYSKYLDPSATTTRLDYCHRTPEELAKSIARHDNITFWNWSKHTQPLLRVVRESEGRLCDALPAKKCPKRRCEFPSQVKYVPHTGLTTEVRENYLAPKSRPKDQVYDTTYVRNVMVNVQQDPSPKHTEYRLLTSGERSQKYV